MIATKRKMTLLMWSTWTNRGALALLRTCRGIRRSSETRWWLTRGWQIRDTKAFAEACRWTIHDGILSRV